jgi:hypothetical protein
VGLLADLTTTTLSVHQGRPLPVARVIVVAIPLLVVSTFLWLRAKGRR